MLLSLLFATLASAQPNQLVAIGDGLVAAQPVEEVASADDADPPAAAAEGAAPAAPLPGGWISVLADCLDEGAPAQWAVVDHARPGETAASAMRRVDDVRKLTPKMVVVGVGAQELGDDGATEEAFEVEVTVLVNALQEQRPATEVVLVGIVPPTVDQMESEKSEEQGEVDGRTEAWNAILERIADEIAFVQHVDLWKDWPKQGAARGKLTSDGWRLSHQGHARVAAAVCDKVLTPGKPSKGRRP